MEIIASTHVLAAGPEFEPVPSVLFVSETPARMTEVEAVTVVTPVAFDDNVIVHDPVPAEVIHGLAEVNEPGPVFVKKIAVPSGAFAHPVPSFTLTCAVNVCGVPTRLVAV
jgi:hypothetical protein